MATNINTILSWFKTRSKPTQEQFWASWSSFWHKDEKIPQSSISDLTTTLDTKADQSKLDTHITDHNAHASAFDKKLDKDDYNGTAQDLKNDIDAVISNLDDNYYTVPEIDSKISEKQDALTDLNFGVFQSTLTTVNSISDTDKISFLVGKLPRMISWTSFKNLFKTINGNSIFGTGNVTLGDMTTNTDQSVSGIKSFLNGKFGLRNTANTFTSFFSNSNTAPRIYTFQDGNGSLMFCDSPNSNLSGTGDSVLVLSPLGTPFRGGKIISLFAFVQSSPLTLTSSLLSSLLSGTTLGNKTLIASTDVNNPMLVVGKSFSGQAFGIISAVSGATFQFIIKIGSTKILDTSSVMIPVSLIEKSFEINYSFSILSDGISGSTIANISILIDGLTVYSISGNPVTIDTTSNKTFDLQFAYGATDPGNSITFKIVKGVNDVN